MVYGDGGHDFLNDTYVGWCINATVLEFEAIFFGCKQHFYNIFLTMFCATKTTRYHTLNRRWWCHYFTLSFGDYEIRSNK